MSTMPSVCAYTAAAAVLLMGLGCTTQARQEPKVNANAQVLQDFNERVAKYLELRKTPEDQAPPMKETKEPAKIQAAQKGLAERIRAARKGARQGDIFTPEIRTAFRRLMYPETKGPEGPETKAAIKEDAPKAVPFKINADYPEAAPLSTVPPNILASLPKLPEELEYRFVDKHMILRDVDANIIVDYMLNAIR
jgi:hypothetical protein